MVNERELLAAWRAAMRVWVRTHDVGKVAGLLAGFSPEIWEVLLAGPECDRLRAEVEGLLRRRDGQLSLL